MPQLLLADTDRVKKSKKVKQWRPRGGSDVLKDRQTSVLVTQA